MLAVNENYFTILGQTSCLGFVKTEKHESESSVAEANESKDFLQKLDFTCCFLVQYTHQMSLFLVL